MVKSRKARLFTAPSMAIDDNHRIDKPHNANGFQDVMERVTMQPVKEQNTRSNSAISICSKESIWQEPSLRDKRLDL